MVPCRNDVRVLLVVVVMLGPSKSEVLFVRYDLLGFASGTARYKLKMISHENIIEIKANLCINPDYKLSMFEMLIKFVRWFLREISSSILTKTNFRVYNMNEIK